MATHDYIISNASGAAVRSDLNNALAAIVSNNSNATEPATTYSYMWWADTTAGQLKLRNAANDGWITIQELDGTMLMEDGAVGTPGLAFASDLDTGFYRPADNELGIATGGTEAARIDSSSRLLVGTSSSSAQISALFQGNSGGSTSWGALNLARGTTSPSSGQSLGELSFSDSGHDIAGLIACQRDGGTWTSGSSQPTRLVFSSTADGSSTPTERMSIDSSGRLLVGTSSEVNATDANSLIHIAGSTSGNLILANRTTSGIAAGSSMGAIRFFSQAGGVYEEHGRIQCVADNTSGSGDKPGRLTFFTTKDGASSVTEALRIDSDQRLTSLPTYNATSGSAANVGISSTGKFFRSTSSIRYKTDVETMEDSYADAILNCRPVWYRSTSPEDPAEYSYWGFIAEEVSQIDERLVTWGKDQDGNLQEEGVQYDRFVPHLLNLIKRQQQAIETLEAKVAALEGA